MSSMDDVLLWLSEHVVLQEEFNWEAISQRLHLGMNILQFNTTAYYRLSTSIPGFEWEERVPSSGPPVNYCNVKNKTKSGLAFNSIHCGFVHFSNLSDSNWKYREGIKGLFYKICSYSVRGRQINRRRQRKIVISGLWEGKKTPNINFSWREI